LFIVAVHFDVTVEKNLLPSDLSFSIIIPARNEEANISACINSVLCTDYAKDKIEIILVNDHSDDDTLEIAKLFSEKILMLDSPSIGKKKAIEHGVNTARYNHIITLDADCIVKKDWIKSWSIHIQKYKPKISTGIVQIIDSNSFLSNYESLDIMNLMAVTNYGIKYDKFYLGNGANLYFQKDFYLASKKKEEYASGDDVFLLQQAKALNEKITFNNQINSSVFTCSQSSLKTLLSQRKRWATKTKGYANSYLLLIQIFVFVVNFSILLLGIYAIATKSKMLFILSAIFFALKAIIDFIYLSKLAKLLNLNAINWYYISSSFLNIFIYLFMSFHALIEDKYYWKGRKTK
jgi:glycosyltransferase involved in cell wall biosynthesis